MGNEIVLTEIIDEYESLVKEVQKLKMVVAALEAEKDDLELNVCRRLSVEYDEKIGHLEMQITGYNLEIERLRSIIESMQAAVNRDEKISPEEAGEAADEKLKGFYEDLGKRAQQAKEDEEFARKRATQDEKNAQDNGYSEDNPDGDDEEFDWDEFFKNINDFNKAFEDFFRAFSDDDSAGSEDYSKSESYDKGGSAKKNVNPAKELKSLYRKIVKALHPDNKKNRTDKDDELLMEAKKAFEEGNLERLRQIAEMIEDEDVEKRFGNNPEDIEALKDLKQRLKTRLMQLEREIQHIKSSFPYAEKEFLSDDDAVAAKQEELNKIIESCKATIADLNERIVILQKQMES